MPRVVVLLCWFMQSMENTDMAMMRYLLVLCETKLQLRLQRQQQRNAGSQGKVLPHTSFQRYACIASRCRPRHLHRVPALAFEVHCCQELT